MTNYLPENIRYLLREKGLTQVDMAVSLEVHESTVSRWLRSIRPIKSSDIQRIAEYLGVTAGQLVDEDLSQKTPRDYIPYEEHNRILNDQLTEYRVNIDEEKAKLHDIESRLISLEELLGRRLEEISGQLDTLTASMKKVLGRK